MFMRWKNGKPGARCAQCATRLSKRWKQNHPDQYREWSWQGRGIAITLPEYQALEIEQGYACAVCRKPTLRMVVDHDHESGAIRGLLCRRCNVLAQDVEVLRMMLDYVRQEGRWSRVTGECRESITQ